MQFKNPEVLYFLFALVLPILVHLFQLKRFKVQEFTNVAFLKEISLQTRKSSQLKKWLLLVCRLFLLATVIFAFAAPYFPAKQQNLANNELVIALDNSFSMQAKGENGPLLAHAIQEILENFPKNKTFSVLTNDQAFWDIDIETAQTDLQNISYTTEAFQLKNIQNKINNKFQKNAYDLVVISDGQWDKKDSVSTNASQQFLYKKTLVSKQNVAIENVSLNSEKDNFNELLIQLNGYGIKDSTAVILSVLENDKVYSKSKIFIKSQEKQIAVNLPKQNFNGKVLIDDPHLIYDNEFYFNITAQNQTNVGIIGKKNTDIEKIFPKKNTDIQYLNSTQELSDYQTIIVSEVQNDLENLGTKLKKAFDHGTQVIYIPNNSLSVNDHNSFFKHFGNLKYARINESKNSITNIHHTHPVYKNVFAKQPENFEYPTTTKNYIINGNLSPILSYSNQEAFAGNITNGIANLYVFASSLNNLDTNILQAPIIVPTLYNMAISNQHNQMQNFYLASNDFMLVPAITNNSEPLTLQNNQVTGIPLQQPIGNKTKVFFTEFPTQAGNYNIQQNNKTQATASLNYMRTESDLSLSDADLFNNFVNVKSIDEVLTQIDSNRLGRELWSYFLLTTLLFLILELLIQKFVK